ncbi:hypothetical protein [Pseudomonas sp. NPDC088444]|uniref:hypothetical protein n=1 Tax=Pseudomonas sp. NPDC088444 TaxID=3364456 RepID=UPI00384A96CA
MAIHGHLALAASLRLNPLRNACAQPAPKSRPAVSGLLRKKIKIKIKIKINGNGNGSVIFVVSGF